ncbi:phosphoribosyltransferase family protein [Methylocystis sp. IM3]|uniref:phosphoribosyltransferase n=1 Tax=unclassified Methylocystis TaxID=2625913 RepID=UPI000FB3F388|nr:MAG: phosphoribosyltransferase [Hyphomicrobiales bacterium]
MPFIDREEAGRRLAEELAPRVSGEDVVVFALPRGGAPVAAPIAEALNAPLDLALVRKIGAPYQPELAMGAVADSGTPVVVRNEDVIELLGVSEARFDEACARECAEIGRRRGLYLGTRSRADAKGRTAIVVDDGVATGATTRAALRAVRIQAPKRLILAVPVASTEALELLRAEADEILCLEAHEYFRGVGGYYADFQQVGDAEVIALLDRYGPGAARG